MSESPARDKVVGARIGAAIIDMIILGALFAIMAALFGDSSTSSDDDGAGFNLNLTGVPFVIYLALSFCYFWLLEAKRGQTPGKMLTGLRVVREDGAPMTYGGAALRTVLRIVDAFPVFYLVGFVAMMASQKGQRVGDMAAQTLVVRK